MKFFVPHAESAEEAESVLQSIASFVQTAVPKQRIYSIRYTHNGKEMIATVGQFADAYYKEGEQPVIAILALPNAYAICLPSRGVVSGRIQE
jgi:hypothetical protein